MKIGIVTVYNSLNCGSFLQSYALQTVLTRMGHDVFFVDAKTRKPLKVTTAKVINALKSFDVSLGGYLIREYFSYYKALKLLNTVQENPDDEIWYILGSDEIWNVKRSQMRSFPIFWGEGLPLHRCISYAPSINNSKVEDLSSIPSFSNNIRHLHAVSVQDSASYLELNKLFSELPISICCDPTVLLESEDYDALDNLSISAGEYVFVYDYDRKREKENKAIVEFAKNKKMKLIVMGEQSWGDVRVPRDPYSFISLIRNANYVITGTFHGTMFSILNRKQFPSIARSKDI